MVRTPDYYEAIVWLQPQAQVSAVWVEGEEGNLHTQAISVPGDGFRALPQKLYFRIQVQGNLPLGGPYLAALKNEVDWVTKDLGQYLKSDEGQEFAQGILPGLTELFAEARILAGRKEIR